MEKATESEITFSVSIVSIGSGGGEGGDTGVRLVLPWVGLF